MCLNINLSFGEHYYSNGESSLWFSLLITLIGAAFGAFVGFRLYIRQEQKLRKKRLKSERKYFLKNLDEAIDFSIQQLNVYNNP